MVKTTTVSALLPGAHAPEPTISETPFRGRKGAHRYSVCKLHPPNARGAWLWIAGGDTARGSITVEWCRQGAPERTPRLELTVDDRIPWPDRLRSPNFRSLINENILGECFRSSSSLINPRISPLTIKYCATVSKFSRRQKWKRLKLTGRPQLSLLIITAVLETNKIEPHVLFYYSMLMYSSIGLL